MSNVNSVRVSALLPNYLVKEVRKTSIKEKVTQSNVIKNALEMWFNYRLARGAKTLADMKFDDLPNEEDWVKVQSKI